MLLHLDNAVLTAGEISKLQHHERLPGNARANAERRCRTLAFVLSTEQPLRAASVAADSCYITWQNTSTLVPYLGYKAALPRRRRRSVGAAPA